MEVSNKAAELIKHTFQATSDRKRYPIKYIQLVKRIQNLSLDIYEYVFDANRLDLKTYKNERLELQTKAIGSCDKLSKLVEISFNLKLISSGYSYDWQRLIEDVKAMTLRWRECDKRR